MYKVLLQRDFRLLWTAGLISTLGDWILAASLPFYIYTLTGSALATGTMFLVEAIPRVAFGYLAGVLADRWNQKWIMVLSDAARALLLLLLLMVHSPHYIWIVYLVGALETTISLLFGPARGAFLPELVDKDHLLQMNTLGSVSDNAARLTGPIIGGALLGLAGIYSVILVDILSYLLSGLLILGIKMPVVGADKEKATGPHIALAAPSFWGQWLVGLKFLCQERWLTVLCIVMGTGMVAQGIINVLLVVFVNQSLHSNALGFGWIMSAQGVGGIVGGILIGKFGKALSSMQLLATSLCVIGLCFFIIINVPVYALVVVLFVLIGVPVVGWIVGASTMLQKNIAREYRGRILGAYSSIQTVSIIAGMGLASIFGGSLGAVVLLNIAAALLLIAGLVTFISLQAQYSILPSSEKDSKTLYVKP